MQKSYQIDELQFDSKTLSEAYQKARLQNRTKDMLGENFRMMDLLKKHNQNPTDVLVKQYMKDIIKSEFLPKQSSNPVRGDFLDPKKVYPLNKPGNFGRELERFCKIVDKGVAEFEENKEPKVKDVKDFVNKIEGIGLSTNSKLGWTEKGKKYPFRLILIDGNNNQKAIYFDNKTDAQNVRIHYCMKFKYRGKPATAFDLLNKRYQSEALNSFQEKAVARHKITKKSIDRYSKQVDLNQSKLNADMLLNTNKSRMENSNIDQSSFKKPFNNSQSQIRESKVRESKARESNYLNDILEKEPPQDKSKVLNLFRGVESSYRADLMEQWLTNAQAYRQRKNQLDIPLLTNRQSQSQRQSQKGRRSVQKEEISFVGIQFLTLSDVLFKPVVKISLLLNGEKEQQEVFNTIIRRKDPYLQYFLLPNTEEEEVSQSKWLLKQSVYEYEVVLNVVNFLTGEELLNDVIQMRSKIFSPKTYLLTNDKKMRLEMNFSNQQIKEKREQREEQQDESLISTGANPTGIVLELPGLTEEQIDKIKQYWKSNTKRVSYYEDDVDIKVFEILDMCQEPPKTWFLGLTEDEYKIANIMNSAASIFGFQLTQAIIPMFQALHTLYGEVEELVETLISTILNYGKSYFFPQHLTRPNKLQQLLGIEDAMDYPSRVALEIATIQKLVEYECPEVAKRFKRKNICYGHLLYQYIHEFFSRNFILRSLVEILNFCFRDGELVELHFLLLSVHLVKIYEDELLRVRRLRDVKVVLTTLKVVSPQLIEKEILSLKEKYLTQSKGIFDEIKKIFNPRPLEEVIMNFYKRETNKLGIRKETRELEKKNVLRSIPKQIVIPSYQSRVYCLHIYFFKLPELTGSLYLKCDKVEYEYNSYEKTRYLIISEVGSKVTLEFIDNKSNEYVGELLFNQGINMFSITLKSTKNINSYKVSYIAGLLSETQIDTIKRNKKFNHFVGPYITQNDLMEELLRPVNDNMILQSSINSSTDDIFKKVKVLFSYGNKLFNEVEFQLRHIESSSLSWLEKIEIVKEYAQTLSQEFFLSHSQTIEKIMIRKFFELTNFELLQQEFECFYNDSLEEQFNAPKVIKCRFFPGRDPQREVRLEIEANNYLCERAANYLFSDLDVNQLIAAIKPTLEEALRELCDGELKILYSSFGELFLKNFPLIAKRHKKELIIDPSFPLKDEVIVIEGKEPEVLMTETMPTFAKISSILDFANSTRTNNLNSKKNTSSFSNINSIPDYLNSSSRPNEREKKKIAENVNLLQKCENKFSNILKMRYAQYPKELLFPFFDIFYDLTYKTAAPKIDKFYLNNTKSGIKGICTSQGEIKFSDNSKMDNYLLEPHLGLYGNLRKLPSGAQVAYFWDYVKDQSHESALVFTNYGYGVFRWEPCIVTGYRNKAKIRKDKLTTESAPKLDYLVLHKGKQYFVREYEVKIKSSAKNKLPEIQQERLYSKNFNKSGVLNKSGISEGDNLKYLTKFLA